MPTLKQSASEWCYYRDSFTPAAYYGSLKQMGYTGVEMVDPSRYAAAHAAGLEIVDISAPGMEVGLNRVEHHAELIPQIRAKLRECADNGIPNLIVFSGNRVGQHDEVGLVNVATALRQIVADAERAKVTLLFEVLNSFDHGDYQADRSSFAFALVRAIGSERLKVLYDLYHMHRMGERVIESVIANLDLVGHLHIAGAPKRDFPGPGQEMDYGPIVRAIHGAGYRGYWGQEFIPGADPMDELKRAQALFEGAVTASARG
ncbi:MAG TPA: sugar phosphate isomerase/epimerase family protein [Planctomycetota bacterium]|nr:sugar phosphate isomerase/epimerase family protein [Planctomycetota bacterium]